MENNENEEFLSCGTSCETCPGCGHHHDDEYLDHEDDRIMILTDEDGNDVKFERLDVIVLDDKEYFIMAKIEEEENEDEDFEVVILELKQDENGEMVLDTVTDEKLAEKVFNEFKARNEDEE